MYGVSVPPCPTRQVSQPEPPPPREVLHRPLTLGQYEFLAHAAIGLGASHLTRHSNGEYHSQALHHRLKAIKHVNERLSNPPKEQSVRDALFAALLCIISQSSLIEDGLVDYMTLSRGGHLLLHVVQGSKLENSLFCKFTAEGHVKAAMEVVREDQRQDFSDMDGFNASVQALAPLIQAPQDQLYYGALAAIYPALMQSSLNGMYHAIPIGFCHALLTRAISMGCFFYDFCDAGCDEQRAVHRAGQPRELRVEADDYPRVSCRLCLGPNMLTTWHQDEDAKTQRRHYRVGKKRERRHARQIQTIYSVGRQLLRKARKVGGLPSPLYALVREERGNRKCARRRASPPHG